MKFSPDLVLRNFIEFENGLKTAEECIPKGLKAIKMDHTFKKNIIL